MARVYHFNVFMKINRPNSKKHLLRLLITPEDVVRIEPRKLGPIINKFLEDVSNYLIKNLIMFFAVWPFIFMNTLKW